MLEITYHRVNRGDGIDARPPVGIGKVERVDLTGRDLALIDNEGRQITLTFHASPEGAEAAYQLAGLLRAEL